MRISIRLYTNFDLIEAVVRRQKFLDLFALPYKMLSQFILNSNNCQVLNIVNIYQSN